MADKTGPTPPGLFFVELADPRAPLSPQTTQISKDNKRGAGKTAESAICMTCGSSYKHEAQRGGARLLDLPQQHAGLFLLLWAVIVRQHLESASETSTSLRVVTALRIHKDPKKPIR